VGTIALTNLLVRIVHKVVTLLVKVSYVMPLMELASLVDLAGLDHNVAKFARTHLLVRTVLRIAAMTVRTSSVTEQMETVTLVYPAG
jgi:hypothetical protein